MKKIKETDIVIGTIFERKPGGLYFFNKMVGYKEGDNYFDLISQKHYPLYDETKDVKTYKAGFYVLGIKHPFKSKDSFFSRTIEESELKLLIKKYVDEYNLEQENIKNETPIDYLLAAGYTTTDFTENSTINRELANENLEKRNNCDKMCLLLLRK